MYLTDGTAAVLDAQGGNIALSTHYFGKGKGIYLSSFEFSWENTRLLLNLIRFAGNEFHETKYITDNLYTECTYYPESKILVLINNSDQVQTTTIHTEYRKQTVEVDPYDTKITHIGLIKSV
ncbi:1,3-beta-galactosyl-N-acetylhexosamine phosphorylase C-terminal domain-containing protein [Paenibacillus xylanivorans]|nr:1,3-beta-galactosyl-N-acetylhexosamine phosphorylase C-terminal domain-containing protein [Paenibacillus xylanivorans]